jgi:hypothetical protein
MHPIAWHLSLDPRTCLLDDPEEARRLARTVLDCGEPFGLVAFRVHGHVLLPGLDLGSLEGAAPPWRGARGSETPTLRLPR